MKYIKFILLVLIIGFGFLFFYQNREYLGGTHAFVLNLYFESAKFILPALATGFYIVFAFLLGLVVMFIISLFSYFRNARELRQLRQNQANTERLKNENTELLEALQTLQEQLKAAELAPASQIPTNALPSGEPGK